MREIKFRGLDIMGNWYYGLLSNPKVNIGGAEKDHWYICNKVGMPFGYEIRPETIGQFTGLKDRNGKEIYKGDIVELYKELHIIHWDEHVAGFSWRTCTMDNYLMFRKFVAENCVFIGNIYENPELNETI